MVFTESPPLPPPDAMSTRSLLDRLDVDGGFTVRRRTGMPVVSGISVAIRPKRSRSFPRASWSDALVQEWLSDDKLGSAWYSPYVGGWIDPASETVFLDVVVIIPTFLRRIACWLGRVTGQRFLYDLCHAETVVLPHRGPKR
jgi:hypothetical protein